MDNNMNSKEYWDYRFVNNWENNAGKLQTLYFCDIANKLFPEWIINKLLEGVSFVDVGCAEGESVDFLSRKYPNSTFTGVDFSVEAIEKAKAQYPNEKFFNSDIREMIQKFDIVFSSNTLEHFHEPFSILNNLFRCAEQYVILLLPFQERDRFAEHFYTFEYEDFNIDAGNFTLVYSNEYDCSKQKNIFWSGKQILLIYEKKELEKKISPNLKNYIGDLSEDYNELKNKNEMLEKQLSEVLRMVKEQQNVIDKSHATIALSEEAINTLNEKLNLTKNERDEINHKYDESIKRLNSMRDQQKERLEYLQRQEEWFSKENYKLSMELMHIHQSNFWKVSKRYYTFRDRTPLVRIAFKSVKFLKNNGVKTFVRVARQKVMKKMKQRELNNTGGERVIEVYQKLVDKYQNSELSGVAVIPSAFPFDELYNQRTINLAKYLSNQGIATLFIIWQWERSEFVEQSFKEVYPLVYSIPMYAFMDHINECKELEVVGKKYAFLNIPSASYIELLSDLRKSGFNIYYDIMDEWEQFSLVGQAPWFDKDMEESLILHADNVVAVSDPLVDKFKHLRQDIVCIGNGYYENLLGLSNIAKKEMSDDGLIHVGYFGHLTESWFDWNLIFKVLEDENIFIHIIGYGASMEIIAKLNTYSNAKYYGKVKPTDLKKYVEQWHIGIIPFTKSSLSKAVDPIKIYEYIYFGLPSVVTGIDHLDSIPHVNVCNNNETEFINQIKESYELILNGSYNYNQLSEFLEKTTWEERFNKLLSLSDREDNIYARLYRK